MKRKKLTFSLQSIRQKAAVWMIAVPLAVLALILLILFAEPEHEGISRAAAYKSAALLLTGQEGCEEFAEELKQPHFNGEDKNQWYAVYMEYLYDAGILNPDTNPASSEHAKGYLTYREASELAEALSPGGGDLVRTRKKKSSKPYPADQWWFLYEELVKATGNEGTVKTLDVLLYGTPMNVNGAPAWRAYTSEGDLSFHGLNLDAYVDKQIRILARGNEIIAMREVLDNSVTYKNVWLERGDSQSFKTHLGHAERFFPLEASLGQAEELVDNLADLTVKDGKLTRVSLKKKRITGKVLAVRDNVIEIEGYGKLKLDKDFKAYRLYGAFEEQGPEDILVGYDIQEFVVAKGKICAALTVREFDAKSIRVLLMDSSYETIFHQSVTLSAKSGMRLSYDDKQTEVPAGAEVILEVGDERLENGRIVFSPVEQGDEIFVNSISRSLGTPSYGGTMEVRQEAEGLVLINELYLEDYLVRVVPSEMPDSYEMEALKAQAVCARTYAYRQIQGNAYSQYGAHVDDSTRFQVYNNLTTSSKTEDAVRGTYGKLLFYGDIPIEAFYFSTSCGHTTDGSVWGSDPLKYPYLDGCLLREERGVKNLTTNSEFLEFIRDKDFKAYDSAYPMYRWEAVVTNRQLESEILSVGTILNVTVTERGVGGIAKKVRIEGADGVTTISGEGQVRAKLGNPSIKITKNDGTVLTGQESLPSAYVAVVNEGVDENNITTFHFYGGGYGHGVGMSQNGAQGMAKEGKTYEEILKFFYHGVEVREADHGQDE